MNLLSSSKNKGQDKSLFEFTNGVDVDARLASQEIRVQKAWVSALGSIGVLRDKEVVLVNEALDDALQLMRDGAFQWRIEDEDIHMNLERYLVDRLGETGKQIHLGRSRNDLIATTLRIFVSDSLEEVNLKMRELIAVLCAKAENLAGVIVPGMTHLQHGQPIRFGHVLAAHGWAFYRDFKRIGQARERTLEVMPLGSAALAGSTLKLDLQALSKVLGFQSPPHNSYDSVGDRDFVVDGLQAFSLVAAHLSRISEDFIIWSSTAIGLVKLPPRWSTGSSIMPNKRNPDVPELIRAKSAHLMAASINAQMILKGLPTSYNSDLHELKRIFIQASDELKKCLEIITHFIAEIEIDLKVAQTLVRKGHLLATEIANTLAMKGVPFREAYQQTAALVEAAENQGISIEDLNKETLKKMAPALESDLISKLNYETSVESRDLSGGTALQSVLKGIEKLKSSVQLQGGINHGD